MRSRTTIRTAFALATAGAMAAAVALPGVAGAAPQGNPQATVTRAVLVQASADAQDITRATLVTQIQVDGQGDLNVNVPVVPGSTPANMDGFGSPTVEDDKAVYNLTVDGPETQRTSQSYDAADVPVEVTVTAKVDGRTVNANDLKGVTGPVEVTYTAKNLTSTPTTLNYTDALGNPITEEVDLPTAMGGTLDMVFPSSWAQVRSEDADVVSGDGSGSTTLSAGYTLFEPFGAVEQSVKVTANVTNGDLPPATLSFTILEPQNNPTARSLSVALKSGSETGATIADAGQQLEAGATELADGLTSASDGAAEIAAGVNDSLLPGVEELNAGVSGSLQPGVNQLVAALENLPQSVGSSPAFAAITGGFAAVNAGVSGVRDSLGVFSPTGAGQFIAPDGSIDRSRTTVARTLWSLIFGVRSADTPAGSALPAPTKPTGGLTNPACSAATPTDPANPCGAWQIVAGVNGGLTQISNGLTAAQGLLLAPTTVGAWTSLAGLLGCTTAPTANGGTVITGCPNQISTVAGANVEDDVATLLAALTGGVYAPDGLADGLGGAVTGLAQSKGALTALQGVITSDPTGVPDLRSPASGTTATGTLNELRAALALGGVGSSGVAGKCAGYVVPGEPSSGPNPRATPEQIAATCSAADVLNISSLALGAVSTGVSSTLLQSISDQLVAGVQPLADGVDDLAAGTSQLLDGVIPLAAGTSELAAGLPAAVDGANTIRTDAAGGLIDAGNAAAKGFGRQVALYDAMNNPELVSSYVPGGAPTGDNVTTNAAFVYELAGTGSGGTNTTANLAIGLLALAGAGGLGYALTRRAKAG
jgi:putative membrane protein